MGSTSINHHFISFVEQSKQVKIKIDSTLELLSTYVDCLPKEKSSNIDVSNMLELNELFSLVDTFLTEFQKSLTIELNVDKHKNKEFKENKNDEDSKTVIHAAKHKNIVCLPNNHRNNGTSNETNIRGVESDIFHRKNNVIDKYNCLEDSASGDEVCTSDGNGCTKKEKTVLYHRNEHVDGEINRNFPSKEGNIPDKDSENVETVSGNVNTNQETIVPDLCTEKVNVKTKEHARTNEENSAPNTCNKFIEEKVPVQNSTHTKTTTKERAQTNEENSAPSTCYKFIEEKVPVHNSTHTKTTNGGTYTNKTGHTKQESELTNGGTNTHKTGHTKRESELTNGGTHTNKTGHTKQESELMYDFDSDSYYSASSSDYRSDACSRSNGSGNITNIERKTLLEINKTHKVSIKHVENLNQFFVYVMTDATKEFVKKWNDMAKFYKKHAKDKAYFLSEDCLEADCNIFVAVLYKSRWCRGRVLGYHRGGFNLYLIDFGNHIESTIGACRHLKSQFHFPSVLQNVRLNLQYSSARQALFDALVNDEILYEARCVRQVGNSFQVVLQEISGISINDIIKGTAIGEMDERSTADAVGTVDGFENTDDGIEDFDPMKEDFFAETNDYNINPDNACQAVIGYIPNDDRRFCKFGKACRKKKCFRLHQEQDPNGWTKDTETILTRAYETADLPQNELVEIQVVSVVNIGEFYAHLERNGDDDEEETFESLTEHMNKVDNVQAMKKLRTQPARGEILIACYKGYYYRGKVLSFNGETDTCQVFFVDIGVSEYVHLKHLRQMESKYNYLPFQAFHFSVRQHLDFILPQESEQYDLCLALFRGLIQFQSFHCVIQSSKTDPADVLLFTRDQVDIVEYYSRCCKRILGEGEETSSVSTSSVSVSTSIGGLNRKDMTFVPA